MAQTSRAGEKKQPATELATVITDSSNTESLQFSETQLSTVRGGPFIIRTNHPPQLSLATAVEPVGPSQASRFGSQTNTQCPGQSELPLDEPLDSSMSAVGGQTSSCDVPPVSTSELEPIPSDANRPGTPSPDSFPPPSTASYRQERPRRCLLCRFFCLTPRICPFCRRM